MIHEVTIAFTVAGKNGEGKTVKEQYLVDNRNLFAEVEDTMYVGFDGYKDLDVIAVKRSKLKEIVNEKPFNDESCKIYIAQIVDHFVDLETEETKDIKYSVALFAHDMNEAHKAIEQYIKQGLEDMDLVSIKETNYNNVLR